MSDVSWAQQQINSNNSVRRASLPNVYVKFYNPGWSWRAEMGVFYASDDSVAYAGPYRFSVDDCAATDWELHT